MACDTIDTWLDLVAQGRTNLPPDKVPWNACKTLLSQCIYGGRIDNDFDQVRYGGEQCSLSAAVPATQELLLPCLVSKCALSGDLCSKPCSVCSTLLSGVCSQ